VEYQWLSLSDWALAMTLGLPSPVLLCCVYLASLWLFLDSSIVSIAHTGPFRDGCLRFGNRSVSGCASRLIGDACCTCSYGVSIVASPVVRRANYSEFIQSCGSTLVHTLVQTRVSLPISRSTTTPATSVVLVKCIHSSGGLYA